MWTWLPPAARQAFSQLWQVGFSSCICLPCTVQRISASRISKSWHQARMLPIDSALKAPSWSKNQTFTLLDFGSWMAPQEGCSDRSRIAKQPFPSRTHIQASQESLMINHPGFTAFASMFFVSQVCSVLPCCWTRSLGCLWVAWTVLPPWILVPRACCPSQEEFSADLNSAQWRGNGFSAEQGPNFLRWQVSHKAVSVPLQRTSYSKLPLVHPTDRNPEITPEVSLGCF